jgi:hypothetical protein
VRERSNAQADGQWLIDAWYEVMDTETFASVHPVNGALKPTEAEAYLNAHHDWVKSAGITKTPTTFMNGYELPAAYRVKDLSVLIPGITDAFVKQNELNTMKGIL